MKNQKGQEWSVWPGVGLKSELIVSQEKGQDQATATKGAFAAVPHRLPLACLLQGLLIMAGISQMQIMC